MSETSPVEETPLERSEERPFGGLSPREAGKRSASVRKARQEAEHGRVPDDGEIIDALRRKAAKGDSNAARELREWRELEQAQRADPEQWMRALTKAERETVRAITTKALARLDKQLRRESRGGQDTQEQPSQEDAPQPVEEHQGASTPPPADPHPPERGTPGG